MYAQAVITDFVNMLNSCFSYLKKITPIHTRNKNVHPFLTFLDKISSSVQVVVEQKTAEWFLVHSIGTS